jgi:cytochrome c oxidase cbb3-type subunit III
MKRAVVLVCCVAAIVAGCEREQRTLQQPPSTSDALKTLRMNDLVGVPPPSTPNPYERNAQALADGKRLFEWFNCSGCHAQGGGGMGPALMDDQWIYGSEPANVVASILQGRPNGMPGFSGRMTEVQAWQLAAYVRSMSGLVPSDAAPSRNDSLHGRPSENRMDPQAPKAVTAANK